MIDRWWAHVRIVLEMIKFEHTLFALPFAFMGAVLAQGGIPPLRTCLWVLVAMVGARSAAMAFNRLVDRHFDAANPRTATRALPAGSISVRFVVGFIVLASLLLILAAWNLNRMAFLLSPVALAIVFFYSFTKRFTAWSHAFLGLALAVAPVGAWIAVAGSLSLPPLLLGAAVLCWLIGFDTIYALQDVDFDRKVGLYSLPARFGPAVALKLARWFHVGMIGFLLALGFTVPLGIWYFTGVALAASLIATEHAIISPTDLRRLNMAFFQLNSIVSFGLFLFTLLDLLL
ncbi:MAG: UbiA-like polyprenyltransferase [Capsulimonadales bacterium]|nr:UbiA-like polyprenyltransferase [Capsulimonadales bacterium]